MANSAQQDPSLFPATSMPDRRWWATLWPDPAGVLQQIDIRAGMVALDLCCGDGYFTAPLAELLDGRVYALELDAALIEQARAEVARRGACVRQWFCADARQVAGLLPERVDYVLLANTFHGVPDQPSIARAVRSVTRTGGCLGIVNWHRIPRERTMVLGLARGPQSHMRMTPAQVAAIVEPAGFRTKAVVELPPYHYGSVFEAVD